MTLRNEVLLSRMACRTKFFISAILIDTDVLTQGQRVVWFYRAVNKLILRDKNNIRAVFFDHALFWCRHACPATHEEHCNRVL